MRFTLLRTVCRSGQYKLVNKIDHLIVKLASICKQPVNECVVYNFLPCVASNAIHGHLTRSSTNLHISTVSSLTSTILFIIVLLLGIYVL
jgi:hypothetical protein